MEAHVCNICGKQFDIFDCQADFGIVNRHIGYGSIHDGEACDLHICCSCFDRLISSLTFAVNPFSIHDDGYYAFKGQEAMWD